MKMNRIGFVGWRGMVGSVLLQRMLEADDFAHIGEPVFFTTSQVGQDGPNIGRHPVPLRDATDLDLLSTLDAVVTCQGGNYTAAVHQQLRARGWRGYWIDAASTLRMQDDSIIILDPVNRNVIEQGLADGKKDFIGGNCTVSLMMMALGGLFQHDLIEWLTAMTYQAISGGGARQMRELLQQMGAVHASVSELLAEPSSSILEIDRTAIDCLRAEQLPCTAIGFPLAGSLLPWIDRDLDHGISREEWKAAAETNKILGRKDSMIPIESICVRIGTMRCHAQAFTIKLRQDIPLNEIEDILAQSNDWVTVVANQKQASLDNLTPAHVSGQLEIPIGRLRKLELGAGYISAFTVGDQLLWGAAEPLRRMLRILAAQ